MDLGPGNLAPEMATLGIDKEKFQSIWGKKISAGNTDEETPAVKRRIKALKKIQVDMMRAETGFYQELYDLESKYLPKFLPFFEKRKKIVSGDHEPSVEECDFTGGSDSEGENEAEKAKDDNSGAVNANNNSSDTEKITGVPNFWLTIFRNVDVLHDLVEDVDEPILKHLEDVTIEMLEKPAMGFQIHFHFSPNPYFTNSILSKTYEMSCVIDDEDPFSFDGPDIVKCMGCVIDWKEGKNVTLKTVSKKQKHKQNNTTRVVTKTVDAPSFFNFFKPPEMNPELPLDEEIQLELNNDFEIGQYIRLKIVPRAVLYYTGEALDDEFDFDEEESEDDDEEGENSGEDVDL